MAFVPVTTRWRIDTHAVTVRCHSGQEVKERESEIGKLSSRRDRLSIVPAKVNLLTSKISQNSNAVVYGGLLINGSVDSSSPFPRFSSLWVVENMNGRPLISPLRVPLMTTRPTAFSPISEKQPAKIRLTSIEVAWPVTAGLGVKVLSKNETHSLN
ncbi:hypothetical protein AVEN_27199-1 [Araneus ventricosus]|uniref:Uncharacterized protein n=1 Tax=Araneus ventricosus TaxID=182803 RepID=A0A4Y2FLV3_ARAVE|nr:hypothetical protein AVEN_27199-1 [Araneus ventricosus]